MALNFDDYFEDVPEGAGKGPESRTPGEDAKEVRPVREYDDDYIEPGTRRRRRRYFKYGLIAALIVAVVVAVYLLFFSMRASGGMVKGYLLSIEKQEGVFDSYECTLVMDCPDEEKWAESMLFRFSTTSQSAGYSLRQAMFGDSLVVIHYDRYRYAMPWRGATAVVADSVEFVPRTPLSRSVRQVKADKKERG